MTQISFFGHDAAHRQIFRSGRWNDWVSLIIANLLVGMSYGWWQSKHNLHHANPNKVGADPDVALTTIAFTPERARQGWYFFPCRRAAGGPGPGEGHRVGRAERAAVPTDKRVLEAAHIARLS